MTLNNVVRFSISVFLTIALSGCFFKVESKYHFDYPIQSDGTVDMRLAPLKDLENFSLAGFYPPAFGIIDVVIHCGAGQLVTMGPPPWSAPARMPKIESANLVGFFSIGADLSSIYVAGGAAAECTSSSTSDRQVVEFAIRVGDRYAPILSNNNLECIEGKIYAEAKHYLVAIQECLALDPRETINPLGYNPLDQLPWIGWYVPQEINVLTILLPANLPSM